MKKIFLYICCTVCILSLGSCMDDKNPNGLSVDRTSLNMLLGERQLIVAHTTPEGSYFDTRDLTWTSSDSKIATVTAFGIVTGVEEGTAEITVTYNDYSVKVPVTVTDPIVVPNRVGSWLFDNATDLTAASVGAPLVPVKGANATIEVPTTDLSGFKAVNGPTSANKAVNIAKGFSYAVKHGITNYAANGRVQEYTMMIEYRIPAKGSWYTFVQTSMDNSNDGEYFINPDGCIGVGSTGYSASSISANEWHRFVVSVKFGGWLRYYIDGTMVHEMSNIADLEAGRFDLDPTSFLLCGDNDGDDAAMDVAELAIFNVALDNQQIKKLERQMSKRP